MKHQNLTILPLYETWNELLLFLFIFFIFRFATFDDATRFNLERRKKFQLVFKNKIKVLFVMKKPSDEEKWIEVRHLPFHCCTWCTRKEIDDLILSVESVCVCFFFFFYRNSFSLFEHQLRNNFLLI